MHPRDAHAGKLDPQGCGSLCLYLQDQLAPRQSNHLTQNQRTAAAHLGRALGLTDGPAIADLTSDQLQTAVAELAAAGMTPATINRQRQHWLALAKAAHAAGLLDVLPKCPALAESSRKPTAPWSTSEVERIFASARTLPGRVGELQSAHWWTALLAVLVETGLPVAELLALKKESYSRRTGSLAVGPYAFQLHPRAVTALNAIRFHDQERLLPWPLDGGEPPFYMLLRKYRELLWRVDLAPVTANLFQRLQLTARRSPSLLASLRLDGVVALRETPLPDTRKPRKPAPRRKSRKGGQGAGEVRPEVVRLTITSPRTLRQFFEDFYLPQRLADASPATAEHYRDVIEFLSWFTACDATVDCLCDDLLERFMAHRKRLGLSNATLNRYRCYLLALWRHAWRKRLVPELPRDVFKYSVSKRLPEAWSTEDVARILAAAAETPGNICGIPAGLYWVALILALYDTGLRITALMSAHSTRLSADGWLSIPAEVQKQDADQAFRLHPDTLAAIRATQPETRELLFPFHSRDRRHALIDHYRKILKRAGLPCGRRDLFHKLRRTSATMVCDVLGEVAAKQHLGHSSVEMTRRYIDPRKLTRTHHAAEAIQRPAWEAPPLEGTR